MYAYRAVLSKINGWISASLAGLSKQCMDKCLIRWTKSGMCGNSASLAGHSKECVDTASKECMHTVPHWHDLVRNGWISASLVGLSKECVNTVPHRLDLVRNVWIQCLIGWT